MPEQEHKLLRQSEFAKMCEIEQQFYEGCVVPDDFDEYEDIPETIRRSIYYLPITIDFCTRSKQEFEEMINRHIISFQRENSLKIKNE